MRLSTKIALILALLVGLNVALVHVVQRWIIWPSFVTLEREEAQKDAERCVQALQREWEHLSVFTKDWAAWDDAYRFVEDRNRDFIDANLVPSTFEAYHLNLIYICNTKGEVVWGQIRDAESEEIMEVPEFPADALPAGHPLGVLGDIHMHVAGIYMTSRGPMLVAARPILTSNYEGPARGTMIMGRFLDDSAIKALEEQTRVAMHVWPVQGDAIPAEERSALDKVTREAPFYVEEVSPHLMYIRTVLPDIGGRPALLLRADVPRAITERGRAVEAYAVVRTLLGTLLIFFVMLLCLRWTVTTPVDKLTEHVTTLAKTGDLSARVRMTRKDEIGVLARAFDGLLQRLQDDIARREAAEKEKDTLESRLRRAQRMEAIGTLAGGIAHDFNNILGVMLGYARLAAEELAGNKSLRDMIEEIQRAGERAADLVKQILMFSRQSELVLQPTKLHDVVEEAMKLVRASTPSTIEIRQDLDAHAGVVMADATQIHQVVVNLCSNAVDAMRDKGGLLEVSLTPFEVGEDLAKSLPGLQPGSHVRLTVRDTGHGMAATTIEHIFDPFFTTKGVGKGTGMGLATVHGVVKSHHGAIAVESEPGKGAVFHVYLPRTQSAALPRAEPAEPLPRGQGHVLLVDDEETLARLGEQMLTRLGYDVTTRVSSVEALELFRERPTQFHVVVTDYTMPDLTGIELAQEIHHIRPNIPVILCTGFSEEISPDAAQAMGIHAYLMKPVVWRELASIIRDAVAQKS